MGVVPCISHTEFVMFEQLYEASQKGELILIAGGLCHYHQRRDGQLTILEILILPEQQGGGKAYWILQQLLALKPKSLFAKCPVDLIKANAWYQRQGFALEKVETTKTGRGLNCWRLWI